jgi:uncharacterized protein
LIAVDANLLIYAYIADLPEHAHANQWLEQQFTDAPRLGLPWTSLTSFLRLVSNPRVFDPAVPINKAYEQVRRWLSAENTWCPEPTTKHADILARCLAVPGLRSDDVPDAHLAAITMGHGLTLATNDRGFARFHGLMLINPLDEQ